MLDWNRFNWPEIFGTIYATKELKGPQYNFMISDIRERSAEKWSDGQLKYVGNIAKGKDYDGVDGLQYESKCVDGLLLEKKPHTSKIILKNFAGNCTGLPEQTFDYMIAYDTTKNVVLLSSWEVSIKMAEVNDSNVTTRLLVGQSDVLAYDVEPVKKEINMTEEYNNFMNKLI
jgi:hypothetical protein|tara:strand:- start:334 stop:852 length:519 start_codon:yes stop_codon:yes gene_type:complete